MARSTAAIASLPQNSVLCGAATGASCAMASGGGVLAFIACSRNARPVNSIHLGAGLLDDFCPLREFLLEESGKLFARAAHRDAAAVRHALLHLRIFHDLRHVVVEQIQEVCRRSGGREQTVPLAGLVALESRFGDSGQ